MISKGSSVTFERFDSCLDLLVVFWFFQWRICLWGAQWLIFKIIKQLLRHSVGLTCYIIPIGVSDFLLFDSCVDCWVIVLFQGSIFLSLSVYRVNVISLPNSEVARVSLLDHGVVRIERHLGWRKDLLLCLNEIDGILLIQASIWFILVVLGSITVWVGSPKWLLYLGFRIFLVKSILLSIWIVIPVRFLWDVIQSRLLCVWILIVRAIRIMVHSGPHKLLIRDIIFVIGIWISFSFFDLVPWALSVWEIACVAVDGRIYSFSCKRSSRIFWILLDFSPWDVLFQWLISFSCWFSFFLRHKLIGLRVIGWHFSHSLINSSWNVGAFEPLWVRIVWSDLWHKLICIREVWWHVT